MIRRLTLSFFLVALGLIVSLPALAQDAPDAPTNAPAGTYQIDPAHTSLYFNIDHLGISTVYGRFNELAGDFTLGDTPAFNVAINTASIDTGVEKRDNHLRSPDFFDARQFPEITFKTTAVENTGNQYKLTGDFTMHGQTREITLPLTYRGAAESNGQQRVGFVGNLTIDRRQWGIDGFQGGVGNDVRLLISVEGVKQ